MFWRSPVDMQTFVKAGMSATEVGKLLKVSRNSVSFWMKDQREPHPLIRERIDAMLKSAAAAIDKGELPLPAALPREERLGELRRILRVES